MDLRSPSGGSFRAGLTDTNISGPAAVDGAFDYKGRLALSIAVNKSPNSVEDESRTLPTDEPVLRGARLEVVGGSGTLVIESEGCEAARGNPAQRGGCERYSVDHANRQRRRYITPRITAICCAEEVMRRGDHAIRFGGRLRVAVIQIRELIPALLGAERTPSSAKKDWMRTC